MSKISDIYEQIKQQQYLLVKTKLQEAIRANHKGRTLSEQEQQEYGFSFDEVGILADLLDEKGLSHYNGFQDANYDYPAEARIVIKSNNEYIMIFASDWGGRASTLPSIIPAEELGKYITTEEFEEGFGALGEEEKEEEINKVVSLDDIDIDDIETEPSALKETPSIEENEENESIDLYDYLYSIHGHYVIEKEHGNRKADYVNTAEVSDMIYFKK